MGLCAPEMQQILPVGVAFLPAGLLTARSVATRAGEGANPWLQEVLYVRVGPGASFHRTLTKRRLPVSKDAGEIVFDPRGAVETEPRALSARVAALNGLRLGVLDNTKWNAGRLLRKTAAKLQKEYAFAAVNYYRKESFSREADPELIETIAADNDITLTAIGD
jgi:hypothetical protein